MHRDFSEIADVVNPETIEFPRIVTREEVGTLIDYTVAQMRHVDPYATINWQEIVYNQCGSETHYEPAPRSEQQSFRIEAHLKYAGSIGLGFNGESRIAGDSMGLKGIRFDRLALQSPQDGPANRAAVEQLRPMVLCYFRNE